MEAKTKRSLIIWGVALLVLLNVSSLGTIWFHRYQFKHDRMSRNISERGMDKRSNRPMRHIQGNSSPFARGLDLSDAQQLKFDSIWHYYNNIRKEIELEMRENRQEMGIIMSNDVIDTIAFYAISAQQNDLMLVLDHSMVNMNLALRNNLNSEQMELFLRKIEKLNNRKLMGRPGDPRKRARTK